MIFVERSAECMQVLEAQVGHIRSEIRHHWHPLEGGGPSLALLACRWVQKGRLQILP